MSPERFDPAVSRGDRVRIEDKLRGALDMIRKDAWLGAQLATIEALSLMERAILTEEDGGDEHGN